MQIKEMNEETVGINCDTESETRTEEEWWKDSSRVRIKMVFELLQGFLQFIVSLNELFMFLCILHTMQELLNASFTASWWICSFYPAIHHCM